jgi:UDP-glucuronate decarboxylase
MGGSFHGGRPGCGSLVRAWLSSPDDFNGPVNLGNPGELTILELAQKIIAMTNSKSQVVYRPLPADDPTQRKADVALAKRALDWTPRVALDDGLTHAIAYLRDTNGSVQ